MKRYVTAVKEVADAIWASNSLRDLLNKLLSARPNDTTSWNYNPTYNGSVDDAAAVQAWINYLQSLPIAASAKIRAELPKGVSAVWNTPITVDASKLFLHLNGAFILAPNGGVIVTASNNATTNYAGKNAQNGGGVGYGTIQGDGDSNGVIMQMGAGGTNGVCHVNFEKLNVRNYLVNWDCSAANTYLLRWWDCHGNDGGTGLKMTQVSNAGENMLWYAGGLHGNDRAYDIDITTAHFIFTGTSYDFNDTVGRLKGSSVEHQNCHVETNSPTVVQFEVLGGGRGCLKYLGGDIWFGGTGPHALPYVITCEDPSRAMFIGTEFFNTRTSTKRFGTGDIRVISPTCHNSTLNWQIVSANASVISGAMTLDVPPEVWAHGSTTDRKAGANGTLSITTEAGGTPSMKLDKTIGAGNNQGFDIFIWCKPGQSVTWRMEGISPSGTTQNYYVVERWESAMINGDGKPTPIAALQGDAYVSAAKQLTTSWAEVGGDGFDDSRICPAGYNCKRVYITNSDWTARAAFFRNLEANVV